VPISLERLATAPKEELLRLQPYGLFLLTSEAQRQFLTWVQVAAAQFRVALEIPGSRRVRVVALRTKPLPVVAAAPRSRSR
jgi:hypothetical protein